MKLFALSPSRSRRFVSVLRTTLSLGPAFSYGKKDLSSFSDLFLAGRSILAGRNWSWLSACFDVGINTSLATRISSKRVTILFLVLLDT